MARVSGEPGKTRMLNVYELRAWGVRRGAWEGTGTPHTLRPTPHALYLLDLPGYGYARASKTDRAAFRRLVAGAIARPRLAGVVWLLDVRHEPSTDDRAVQATFAERGTRVLAAFTKGDKLPRGQRLRREHDLRDALGLADDQAIVTSARTGDGVAELRDAIGALVREGTE